jgi:hypothetical protein
MLFEIVKTDAGFAVSPKGLVMQPPSNVGLLESDIERWLVDQPNLLLPNEQLLVIARSVAGKAMADILALDALGRLVIVEIKRDWSDRTTVGQLLEYAARLRTASFDELQSYARRYRSDPAYDLHAAYQGFAEGPEFQKEELGRAQRVFIVAPESDVTLRSIVDWLQSYNVPIEFVPFSVYADVQGVPRFLQLEGVVTSPEPVSDSDSWAGHWIFNTNETHAPGSYKRMFERDVAAIYGYPNGPANLEGATTDDKVLAYVNQQGLRAVGTVLDPQVRSGVGVFIDAAGSQLPDEYHLKVRWEVVAPERAISSADAAARFGYNLPVRSVFAKLHRGSAALRLEQELRSRAKVP